MARCDPLAAVTGGNTMQPGPRLPGKVAIVSGGASGIGAETARAFAAHGASVVLCDLQDDLGQAVAQEIRENGGTAEYRNLDVRDEAQWIALVRHVEQTHGKLNILANIAGISGRPAGMTVQASGVMT